MVWRREKLKNRVKKWKSKRKGIERSLSNPLFLEKLVQGLWFPITRFYAKNIQKMSLLNEDQTDKIVWMVTKLWSDHQIMRKRESKISRKLHSKGVYIDQVDFFDQLVSNYELIPHCPDDDEEQQAQTPAVARWKLDDHDEEPVNWSSRPMSFLSPAPNFSMQKYPDEIFGNDHSICKSAFQPYPENMFWASKQKDDSILKNYLNLPSW